MEDFENVQPFISSFPCTGFLQRLTGCFYDVIAVRPMIDRTHLVMTKVKAGKPVHFDVNIKGEPPPKVTWILKDEPV